MNSAIGISAKGKQKKWFSYQDDVMKSQQHFHFHMFHALYYTLFEVNEEHH